MTLDNNDLRTARTAVAFYRRAYVMHKRPVPPAVTALAQHLTSMLAEGGQETVVPQQEWLTTRQVATRLRCSQRTARRIAAQVGRKAGHQWLIPADAVPEEDR